MIDTRTYCEIFGLIVLGDLHTIGIGRGVNIGG